MNQQKILHWPGIVALALALCFAAAEPACARVFIGGGVVIGAPYYAYPPYYAYYPPPYYPPPPTYPYAPPPAVYPYPMPPPAPADRYYSNNGQYCREYHHTVTIGGQPGTAVGHACRQPDGSWHIID